MSLKTVTIQSEGLIPHINQHTNKYKQSDSLHHIHLDHYNYWNIEKSSEISSIMLSSVFVSSAYDMQNHIFIIIFLGKKGATW